MTATVLDTLHLKANNAIIRSGMMQRSPHTHYLQKASSIQQSITKTKMDIHFLVN